MAHLSIGFSSVTAVHSTSTTFAVLKQNAPVTALTWIPNLSLNVLSYLLIMLPLFILRIYFLRHLSVDSSSIRGTCLKRFMFFCFGSDVQTLPSQLPTISHSNRDGLPIAHLLVDKLKSWFGLNVVAEARSSRQHYCLLALCVCGLQFSYILWGIMQERIMTRAYDGELFGTSQFLVFCNRLMTVFIVLPIHILPLGVVVNPWKRGRRAPFFEFSFASLSNILSSWCQYEALKYVSFPTQVLSKACKVIPVMLMGRFVQRRSYSTVEYFTAGLLCLGLNMFLLSDPSGPAHSAVETPLDTFKSLNGVLLILSYVLLDSFTSNWQDHLFQRYSLTSLQVMAGVNFWSILLTLVPLSCHGNLLHSLRFGCRHPRFFLDVFLSATCSATGQAFIFLTIANFGPATFAIIATLRMGLSILISCFIFSHAISYLGIVGIVIVFSSLFLRIYLRSSRPSNHKKSTQIIKPTNSVHIV